MPDDERTANLNLPLPCHPEEQEYDYPRLRDALTILDAEVATGGSVEVSATRPAKKCRAWFKVTGLAGHDGTVFGVFAKGDPDDPSIKYSFTTLAGKYPISNLLDAREAPATFYVKPVTGQK